MKDTTTAALPSDEAIIDLYWNRDEAAIAETDRKYRGYLHTVAWNIVKDEQDCEECLNDTYLSAWNTIPPERPYLLKAFLAAIIRNQSLMVGRRQKAQKRTAMSQAVSLSELEDVLADIDGVLVMTVNPGFAGQKLVPQTLNKITRLREMLDKAGRQDVRIEVDGNVSFANADKMSAAGADIFVVGSSSVFSKEGTLEENTKKFREIIERD